MPGSFAYLGAAGARLLVEPRLARRATIRWKTTPEAAWQQSTGAISVCSWRAARRWAQASDCRSTWSADDGRFEIVLVEKSPRLSVAFHLPRLRSGTRPPAHILTIHHATEAVVEWLDGSSIVGDGEDLGEATTVEARLLPGALRVSRAASEASSEAATEQS